MLLFFLQNAECTQSACMYICMSAINNHCCPRQTISWFWPWRCGVFTVRYEVAFRGVLQQTLPSDIYRQLLGAEATLLRSFAKLPKAIINLVVSVCLSVCLPLFVRPHGTTRLPLGGYSRNLIFDYFSKIYRKKSSLIK